MLPINYGLFHYYCLQLHLSRSSPTTPEEQPSEGGELNLVSMPAQQHHQQQAKASSDHGDGGGGAGSLSSSMFIDSTRQQATATMNENVSSSSM